MLLGVAVEGELVDDVAATGDEEQVLGTHQCFGLGRPARPGEWQKSTGEADGGGARLSNACAIWCVQLRGITTTDATMPRAPTRQVRSTWASTRTAWASS